MPTIKLKINLVDKRKIFPMKAKYDPETRLAQVQRGIRQMFPTKFQIDPDHIYEQLKGRRRETVCFVDNASRKSIEVDKVTETIKGTKKVDTVKENTGAVKEKVEVGESKTIHTNDPVDGETKNILDYLIEEKFWKSLIAKTKLPLSTVVILLCAGGGIFYIIRDIVLPIFGVPT